MLATPVDGSSLVERGIVDKIKSLTVLIFQSSETIYERLKAVREELLQDKEGLAAPQGNCKYRGTLCFRFRIGCLGEYALAFA